MQKKFLAIIVFSNLISTLVSNIVLLIQTFFIPINFEFTIIMNLFFLALSLIIFFNVQNVKWLGKTVKNDSYHIQTGYALATFITFLSLSLSIIIWLDLLF